MNMNKNNCFFDKDLVLKASFSKKSNRLTHVFTLLLSHKNSLA